MAESNREGRQSTISTGNSKWFNPLDSGVRIHSKFHDPKTNKVRYKQCYREVWETMKDFKGWLTSVPDKPDKAFCKLCQKELHCHRLSLLKHKVTLKHQRREEAEGLIEVQVETKPSPEEETSENETEEVVTKKEEPSMAYSTDEESDEGNTYEVEMLPGGPLSTHVLDLTKGTPGPSVQVLLYKLVNGRWTLIHEGVTNNEGRYDQFYSTQEELTEGRYKLHFETDKYYQSQNQTTIFPFIEIVFDVTDATRHYHIPLLLSPYGYSTYRGS